MMHYLFIGSGAAVKAGLQDFLTATDVDEIMVASHIYDAAAKQRSYEIIAPFFKKAV